MSLSFAQHIGRALVARRYGWTDFEPAPHEMTADHAKAFNFGVFSARTGNIYTANMLLQWVKWALGKEQPPEEFWQEADRFYDPFRPAIEPDGFASPQELLASRAMTIEAFGKAIRECNLFVFTLGLTESWRNRALGYEYAICPGTMAGTFNAEKHVFVNQRFNFVHDCLSQALQLIRSVNPESRTLLTVSPVPLTATATGQHVLVATVESKSILRAVAGELAATVPRIDYFPSYEIISSAPFGGRFFAANKRSVLPEGVEHVMSQFFAGQEARFGKTERAPVSPRVAAAIARRVQGLSGRSVDLADDLVCEEQLLGAFAPKA